MHLRQAWLVKALPAQHLQTPSVPVLTGAQWTIIWKDACVPIQTCVSHLMMGFWTRALRCNRVCVYIRTMRCEGCRTDAYTLGDCACVYARVPVHRYANALALLETYVPVTGFVNGIFGMVAGGACMVGPTAVALLAKYTSLR